MVYSPGGRASEERRCTDIHGWTLLQLSFKEHVSSRKLLICEEFLQTWWQPIARMVCLVLMWHLSLQPAPRTRTCNTTQRCKPVPTCQPRNHHAQPSRWGPPGSRARRPRPPQDASARATQPSRMIPGTAPAPARHGLTVNVPAACLHRGMLPKTIAALPDQLLVPPPYVAKAFFCWCHCSCGLSETLVIFFGFIIAWWHSFHACNPREKSLFASCNNVYKAGVGKMGADEDFYS
jgi:hypothetical protein